MKFISGDRVLFKSDKCTDTDTGTVVRYDLGLGHWWVIWDSDSQLAHAHPDTLTLISHSVTDQLTKSVSDTVIINLLKHAATLAIDNNDIVMAKKILDTLK